MNRKKPKSTAKILIDGYNLMFQSVRTPDSRDGDQALRKARSYFLSFIAERLPLAVRSRTWIVFDSNTQRDLPSQGNYQGMRLIFAREENSADELLIKFIQEHPTPKQLTVVSSDHQIQRRALARGASAFDSEDWVTGELPSEPLSHDAQESPALDPSGRDLKASASPISEEEKNEWLKKFGF